MTRAWNRVLDPALVLPAAILVTALCVVAVAPAFADGKAITHARQHAGGGVAGAVAAAAVAIAWRPRWNVARAVRLAAIGALTLFGAAQTIESIAATGYNPTNVFAETEGYADLHERSNALTTLSILFVMLSVGLVVVTLVVGRRRTESSAREGLL